MKPAPSQRSEFQHWTRVQVRWGDMDSIGHVNNARFLTYFEMGRVTFVDSLPRQIAGGEEGPILVRVECNYRRQLFFPAEIEVGTRIQELRHRSFVMKHAVFSSGGDLLVADGISLLAWINYREQQPRPIPEAVREILTGTDLIPTDPPFKGMEP